MGIHPGVIDHLKRHPVFGEAFVDELPCKVDVLVQDISHLLRTHTCGVSSWEGFRTRVVKDADDLLQQVHTLLFCADNNRYVPPAKQVEGHKRSQRKRNGLPLEPLSDGELKQECITSRQAGLPDMDRALITPRLKEFFPALYADFVLGGVVLDPTSEYVKTLVLDGVADELDPMQHLEYHPKTFEKRTKMGVSETERVEIGESDLRWVRWLHRFANEGEESWGRWSDGKMCIVLNMNDGDVLPIALLNLCSFLPQEADFPFRLYVHHGSVSKWYDYLPNTVNPDGLKRRGAHRMVDVIRLWELVIAQFGGEYHLDHAIEVFCALVLTAGSDYVKSVNSAGVVGTGAPFKGIAFSELLKTFMQNERARMEFGLQLRVPTCLVQAGNPKLQKAMQFHDERVMLGLLKRIYQQKFRAYLLPPDGDVCESFEAIRKADNRKRAEDAKKKHEESTQMLPNKRQRTVPVQTGPSDILTETESLAVVRRIFWNMDYWLRGWTGRYDWRMCLECDKTTRVSRWGYLWDPEDGRVKLASRVFI